MPAELSHPGFEGHPRAQAGLLENERQEVTCQVRRERCLFQPDCFFEYRGTGFENVKAFYQRLDEQATLLRQFAPEKFRYSGPIIKIYKL